MTCPDEKEICDMQYVHRNSCDIVKRDCRSDWEKIFASSQSDLQKQIASSDRLVELKWQTITGQLAEMKKSADDREKRRDEEARLHKEDINLLSKRIDILNDKIDGGFQKLLYQMLGMMVSGIGIGVTIGSVLIRMTMK